MKVIVRNVAMQDGELFCKNCFMKQFKEGGGKYGGQAPTFAGSDAANAVNEEKAAAVIQRRSSVKAEKEVKKEVKVEAAADEGENGNCCADEPAASNGDKQEEDEEKPKKKLAGTKNLTSMWENKKYVVCSFYSLPSFAFS